MAEIPIVLAYVRLTGVGVELDALEALNEAIKTVVSQHAETWGVRVRRRVVGMKSGMELLGQYAERSKLKTPHYRVGGTTPR